MSDTSLVFNVLGRERIASTMGRVAALFRSAGQQAEQATKKAKQSTAALDREIADVERSLAALNAEFAATGNKELFARIKRDRGLLTQLRSVRDEVGRANSEIDRANNTSSRAGAALMRLGTAASGALASGIASAGSGIANLATNVWNLVPAALAGAAGLAALGPAAYLAGGAIGSLPAIIAGAAAALAVFKLGFMGLGEAYKAATTATGGGAKAARDMTAAHRAVEQAAKGVARAERDVAEAQRAAREATLAVADAVEEERRRRGELTRDLVGARLDEEDAADAVQDAEEELRKARARGASAEEIDDLDRAYRRAQATLVNSKARTKELEEQQKDAAKTGVDGSDLVAAAKERERQALMRVKDAQDAQAESVQRLADAQKALNAPAPGGGGGGGIASPKLAASAKKFLDVVLSLRPAFEKLRLHVQERLFAGLGERLRTLATAWMPQLNKSLGSMAGTFNGIFKKFSDTASRPEFISNVASGVEGVRVALDKVGKAAAGPLTKAFGQLAKASKPFVEALGGEVAKLLGDFSKRIDKLSEGGENSKLSRFFRSAADVMRDAFRMLRSIGSIAGSVLGMIFGDQVKGGTSAWKDLANALDSVAVWFKDPENQERIRGWIGEIKTYGGEVAAFFQAVGPVVGVALSILRLGMNMATNSIKFMQNQLTALKMQISNYANIVRWVGRNAPAWWNAVKRAAGAAKDWIVKKWDALVGYLGGLKNRIGKKVSGLWDGIKTSFRNTINWLISKWNGLQFTIGGGSFLGVAVPSASFGTPDIPYLAKGGIVPATPGGRLAVLGEGGHDEAVIPLDRGGRMAGGGPQAMPVLRIDVTGAEGKFKAWIREMYRTGQLP